MSSYVTQNLMREEQILSTAKIHWFAFVAPSLLLAVTGLPLLVASLAVEDMPVIIGLVGFCVFGIPLLKEILNYISTEMVVTNKRIIGKKGIIARNAFEIHLSKVEGAQVVQGILGRIFGFGTVQIRGTGMGANTYKHIAQPLAFQRDINQAIDDNQNKKSS